jgi:hypothetical protein
MVCESINPKVPHFNAPIYLENKVGIDLIFYEIFSELFLDRHQSARLTRSWVPLTRFTLPSNHPKVSRPLHSSSATSSISPARSSYHSRSFSLSPSPLRVLSQRSRSPAEVVHVVGGAALGGFLAVVDEVVHVEGLVVQEGVSVAEVVHLAVEGVSADRAGSQGEEEAVVEEAGAGIETSQSTTSRFTLSQADRGEGQGNSCGNFALPLSRYARDECSYPCLTSPSGGRSGGYGCDFELLAFLSWPHSDVTRGVPTRRRNETKYNFRKARPSNWDHVSSPCSSLAWWISTRRSGRRICSAIA